MQGWPNVQERQDGLIPLTSVTNEHARAINVLGPVFQTGAIQGAVLAVFWPIKVQSARGFGKYLALLGTWKTPMSGSSDLNIDTDSDFSKARQVLLINPPESEIQTNRIAPGKVVYGWLTNAWSDDDPALPVASTKIDHAVRFNRFKQDTGELQETYVTAKDAASVTNESDWHTWTTARVCPPTQPAAAPQFQPQDMLAYSMALS